MLPEYKIVYEMGMGEIILKKSRFISTVIPIRTEENALMEIEKTKKKYQDASHNCFAYVLGINQEIQRCSDDGEPSGTAGKPILDVLLGEEIHNALIIVTRYFGGTLLGTGGLVRAYQSSAKEGLSSCVLLSKIPGVKLQLSTDYNGVGKLQYTIASMGITTIDTIYTEAVTFFLLVPVSILDSFTKKWTTLTNGSPCITKLQDIYFAVKGNDIIIFDEDV